MSAEIIKVYKQNVPALRFIGKKYGDNDRVNGNFGKIWDDWFRNGWFDPIVKQTTIDRKSMYEDGEACIGLMRHKDGEPFQYWVGLFMPENTVVPNGYECQDFPKRTLGVCWVQGKEPEIFMQEERCMKKLEEEKYECIKDEKDAWWFFERYGNSRFMTADENGKVILDICWFIK